MNRITLHDIPMDLFLKYFFKNKKTKNSRYTPVYTNIVTKTVYSFIYKYSYIDNDETKNIYFKIPNSLNCSLLENNSVTEEDIQTINYRFGLKLPYLQLLNKKIELYSTKTLDTTTNSYTISGTETLPDSKPIYYLPFTDTLSDFLSHQSYYQYYAIINDLPYYAIDKKNNVFANNNYSSNTIDTINTNESYTNLTNKTISTKIYLDPDYNLNYYLITDGEKEIGKIYILEQLKVLSKDLTTGKYKYTDTINNTEVLFDKDNLPDEPILKYHKFMRQYKKDINKLISNNTYFYNTESSSLSCRKSTDNIYKIGFNTKITIDTKEEPVITDGKIQQNIIDSTEDIAQENNIKEINKVYYLDNTEKIEYYSDPVIIFNSSDIVDFDNADVSPSLKYYFLKSFDKENMTLNNTNSNWNGTISYNEFLLNITEEQHFFKYENCVYYVTKSDGTIITFKQYLIDKINFYVSIENCPDDITTEKSIITDIDENGIESKKLITKTTTIQKRMINTETADIKADILNANQDLFDAIIDLFKNKNLYIDDSTRYSSQISSTILQTKLETSFNNVAEIKFKQSDEKGNAIFGLTDPTDIYVYSKSIFELYGRALANSQSMNINRGTIYYNINGNQMNGFYTISENPIIIDYVKLPQSSEYNTIVSKSYSISENDVVNIKNKLSKINELERLSNYKNFELSVKELSYEEEQLKVKHLRDATTQQILYSSIKNTNNITKNSYDENIDEITDIKEKFINFYTEYLYNNKTNPTGDDNFYKLDYSKNFLEKIKNSKNIIQKPESSKYEPLRYVFTDNYDENDKVFFKYYNDFIK